MNDKLGKKIVYLIPGVTISGGIAVIFQHVNRLLGRGYDVSVVNFGIPGEVKWFDCNFKVIHWDTAKSFPIRNICVLIATQFSSLKYAGKVEAERKIYFVQSDERRFNITDKEILECEKSYQSKAFEYMTEAKWIQRWLKEEYGYEAYYVPNGIDKDLFHRTETNFLISKKPRVLLEGQINVPFKGMHDAYEAIEELDCEIWIASNYSKPPKEWRYNCFYESVPMQKMKDLYSSCDIFLKMSKVEGFFGPPLEAMACGCSVVVGKCTGYDEYIVNGKNALVVEMGDILGAKKAVKKLISDNKLRKQLIENGYSTAAQWNWDKSTDMLEKVIRKEEIEIFYTNDSPERYDYVKTVKNIMLDLLINEENNKNSLNDVNSLLNEKQSIINWMENSKFWKLRNKYVYIKSLPKRFINKSKLSIQIIKIYGMRFFFKKSLKYLKRRIKLN